MVFFLLVFLMRFLSSRWLSLLSTDEVVFCSIGKGACGLCTFIGMNVSSCLNEAVALPPAPSAVSPFQRADEKRRRIGT